MVEGFIGKVGYYKGTVAVDQLRIVERTLRKGHCAAHSAPWIGEVPTCAFALLGLSKYHDDTTRCDQDRNPGRRHIGAGSLPSAGGTIFDARESDLPV